VARTRLESIGLVKFKEKYEWEVLHYARNGDWKELASYVEHHRVDNHELRMFIGAIIRGKKKRPNNRAPAAKSRHDSLRRSLRVVWAVYVEGMGREAAIDWVADEMGLHRRTIQRDIKKNERYHIALLAEAARANKLVGGLKRKLPQLTLGERERAIIAAVQDDIAAQDLFSMRYEIDETALSQHFLS
jgi:hypothetical protein